MLQDSDTLITKQQYGLSYGASMYDLGWSWSQSIQLLETFLNLIPVGNDSMYYLEYVHTWIRKSAYYATFVSQCDNWPVIGL